MSHILAIDQGTTSTRAIVFDREMRAVATAQEEFPQHFPGSGWVEHDAEDLWQTTLRTCRAAIERAGVTPAAIGITNQRETTVLWERATGRPVAPAIVWQDRRTAALCADLVRGGHEPDVTERTGLLLDPYFSGTKVRWLLDAHDLRDRARAGEILFGTVDSWLIWNLTEGRAHVTDATNAARTLLFNIRENRWDAAMLRLLDVPEAMLPEVHDCAAEFGVTSAFGPEIPILGVAGDQQAATLGQACFAPGMLKSTYGTGCFALLNTGDRLVRSRNRLLGTIAYRLDGRVTYALEGSIFVAGAVVQWLRDGLRLIAAAGETQALAERADPNQRLVIVPAFTGLGAPHWRPEARGAVFGLTRNSGPAEFARAALESVGFQTRDLLEAMRADWPEAQKGVLREGQPAATLRDGQPAATLRGGQPVATLRGGQPAATLRGGQPVATLRGGQPVATLRVDGGMVASDWAMGFLSDIIGAPVDRPAVRETTALGAAWLAGMRAGLYPGPEDFARTWRLERRFEPRTDAAERDARYADWRRAVAATIAYAGDPA